MNQDWKTVDQEAEKGLRINPWDPQLEAWVGEACDQRGYRDVAIFAYTNAIKKRQGKRPIAKVIGRSL